MEVQLLSETYMVSVLEDRDVPAVVQLCEGNPLFYQHCPPPVSEEGIRADMRALPPGKGLEDKYYLGFWSGGGLVAVMDLILRYPDEKTAFIGFFMMNAAMQGRGIGTKIVDEACACLKREFSFIRLGYVKGNCQSKAFWTKNRFRPTGVTTKTEDYEIVVMQREL